MFRLLFAIAWVLSASLSHCQESLLPNGSFESGLTGWRELWTRQPDTGAVALDTKVRHQGKQSVRIEYTGQRDWSLHSEARVECKPGDIFELSAWVKVTGAGSVTLCVVTYEATGKTVSWVYAGQTQTGTADWKQLRSRIIVPDGVAAFQPRFIGYEPATIWVDEAQLLAKGNVSARRPEGTPPTLTCETQLLRVKLDTRTATLTVTDRRCGQVWRQAAYDEGLVVTEASAAGDQLNLRLLDVKRDQEVKARFRSEAGRPEVAVEVEGQGPMDAMYFPHPFITGTGTFVILPMNEGISYPVDDETIPPWNTYLYGGHGLCMPFYGATDLARGYLAIVETPDDAGMRMDRAKGLLRLVPRWDPQKGRWGYVRKLRYVFFEQGGYVAMCKRYREYVKAQGRLKTLAEKREANPNVDKLIGAVNVWCWDNDAPARCRELREAGIDRILWSNRRPPDQIRALNAMGVLSSRYDLYQDVMDPGQRDKLRGWHPDWPAEAWPQDLMLDENGVWRKGWRVRAKDGTMIPCGVLCDRLAPDYARKRIGQELKTSPYQSRFIDTTTASPWRECYSPDHPMTRSDSRHWKRELLRVVSEEFHLVCGSETGHEAAVPFVHYFEGMLSLGPYRVPDAGRDMARLWDEVPERVAKFQTGHFYRLPLWELVYHDCVVAHWYWGDYNNKLPALWDRRDLINVLYGTPPMFMFSRKVWEENRDRFAQSYQTICPTVRQVGYQEMTDHQWLTPDHTVQQTTFANGVRVVVNFAEETSYRLADGRTVEPLGRLVAR